MKNALRNLTRLSSKAKFLLATTASSAMFAVSAFAAEPASVDITGIMGTALEGVQTQTMGVIGVAAPIAVGIMATFMVFKYGLKFFKRTTDSGTA